MASHTILIDGNNFGFAGMSNPRLSSGERDTQSIFSVIRRIQNIVADNPGSSIIVLWDGRSWRKDFYTEYKANREKTEKDVEARQSYFDQKKEIIKGLQLLGIRQIWGTNWEADDLAAILAKGLEKAGGEVVLMTADKDWQQLVTSRSVIWRDVINGRECTYDTFADVTGFDTVARFIEAKCILGDPSDNIKGIHGIGPKALEGIYNCYESFLHFSVAMEHAPAAAQSHWKAENGKAMPKAVRELDVSAGLDKLTDNWTLVDLHTFKRPKVDKMIDDKGKLDFKGFQEFCHRNAFLSITKRLDSFLRPFEENKFTNK